MSKEILKEIDNTNEELLQLISSFKQDQLNTIPFEGSWTAAQVADHIFKSESLILKTLHGEIKQTERKADEKIETIKESFLDFDTKMISPEFIQPTNTSQSKETLLSSLESKGEEMNNAIKALNLSETCTSFAPPGIDELTRLEWVYFFVYHTQRHIHQLKNIFKVMNGSL